MHMRESYFTVLFCRYGDFVDKIIFALVYWPIGSASVVLYTHKHDELRSIRFNPLNWCAEEIEVATDMVEPLLSAGIHYLIKGRAVSHYHYITHAEHY